MANLIISDYALAGSIDGSNDLFLMEQDSTGSYKSINRNVLLGVTGQPADISSAQNITNKTLNNTNTITTLDNSFTLQDNSDNTKQAQFQLSGLTTATTRTYTLPDVSDTIVSLTATQTMTNKTLTSPSITGGTIANPTLTVDAISEYTSANGVTIDGLNIKDSALNTSNSVPNNAWNNTGAFGSTWGWVTWTPTISNLTVGNGTLVARYTQIGKLVNFYIRFVYGSTSSVAGAFNFNLPVTAAASWNTSEGVYLGGVRFNDASGYNPLGVVILEGGSVTNANITAMNTSNPYVATSAVSSTVPFTWTTSDEMTVTGSYEAA